MRLEDIADDNLLLEVARRAIEDDLVFRRDARIWTIRGNGLVIREQNGADSSLIRMGPEEAFRIGLLAVAKHLEATHGVS